MRKLKKFNVIKLYGRIVCANNDITQHVSLPKTTQPPPATMLPPPEKFSGGFSDRNIKRFSSPDLPDPHHHAPPQSSPLLPSSHRCTTTATTITTPPRARGSTSNNSGCMVVLYTL
ncbi:hypothetical protein Tco_1180974 [Tanacetum coccineum]